MVENGSGLLFKLRPVVCDNNNDEYKITTTAQLGAGTTGGYGILFDTSLQSNNADTGYVLQFDRGYGGIVIRSRTNGNEGSALLAVTNKNNPLIPSSKQSDWWTTPQQVTLSVSASGTSGKKILDVWIGDTKVVSDWSFDSAIESANNFTGIRSWGVGTTYSELDIG